MKIWGEARVIEDDPALIATLMPDGLPARPEQAILFTVAAWDGNCPQHIPQRLDADEVAAALAERDGASRPWRRSCSGCAGAHRTGHPSFRLPIVAVRAGCAGRNSRRTWTPRSRTRTPGCNAGYGRRSRSYARATAVRARPDHRNAGALRYDLARASACR